jgi:hypothetical protein
MTSLTADSGRRSNVDAFKGGSGALAKATLEGTKASLVDAKKLKATRIFRTFILMGFVVVLVNKTRKKSDNGRKGTFEIFTTSLFQKTGSSSLEA